MTYESVTAEMVQALTDEVEAIKKSGTGQQIPLLSGIRTGVMAGRFIYAFTTTFEVDVLDDTPAQLRIRDQAYDVVIITVSGFDVTIATVEDLGDNVPQASLSLAPYFLLEMLKKRLDEILSGRIKANKQMAMRLFNLAPNEAVRFEGTVEQSPAVGEGSCNPAQRQAISKVLTQSITFIWGPPGTGKTRTITYICPLLLKSGERLLITSHTNAAVDVVLKAAKKGLSDAEVWDGAIVRVGTPKEPDPDLLDVTVDAIVARKSAELRAQQASIQGELEKAKQEERHWTTLQERYKALENAQSALLRAEQTVREAEERCSVTHRQVTTAGDRCTYIQGRLREAESTGLLRRIIAGLNPERLRRELHLWNSQLEAAQGQEALASAGQVSASSSLMEAQQRLLAARKALAQTSNLPPAAEVAKRLEDSAARVKSLVAELATISQKISEIESAVLAEARIVGATLSKLSTTPDLYKNLFDDVIVDEVSMTPQPHLWLASSVANKRVVCLGDFRQLGPIFSADSEMAKERLAKDIFTQAGIVDASDHVLRRDPRLASLSIQYRMHPVIGELVNALVYRDDGNELAHMAQAKDLKAGLEAEPSPGIPIVLYDTSAANPWCARMEPGFSRYNIYSALVTIRVAEQASRQSPNVTIGVVTPYAVQTRLLKILATEHGLPDSVKVATVHRFQGNEMDMMVFDLVDGPPFAIGTLMRGPQGRRLLNVAVSRAKGKLVVVANQAFFATKSAGDDPLGKTLLYLRGNAQWVNSQTLLRGYGDDELLEVDRKLRGTLHVGYPEGMTFHDENTFYGAFVQDLLTAKEQVIVFSPFIRPGRTAQMVSTFRALIERGVEVHILTRGGWRRQATEEDPVVAALQEVGVKVSTRKGLHEKLAFIDDQIAWEGSLNILSQASSTEHMTRFANARIAASLLEFSGVSGLLRREKRQEEQQARLESLLEHLTRYMVAPVCPKCGRAMVLRPGAWGPFFGCPDYPRCQAIVNVPRQALIAAARDQADRCPKCGATMEVKWVGRARSLPAPGIRIVTGRCRCARRLGP